MAAISCNTNRQGKLKYGKWDMLTVHNNDTIIFEPCESGNRYIVYKKDSVIDYTGQEVIRCKIASAFYKENKHYLVFEPQCSYSDTLVYEIKDQNMAVWHLYNRLILLSTDKPEKYRTVREKCSKED